LAYDQGNFENALRYTIQAYVLFDALRSPFRASAQLMIAKIRNHVDEETFTRQWQKLADSHPLPPSEVAFVTDLNHLCKEMVATLRTRNVEQLEVLVTRIEQMLKSDFPMEGAQNFLVVLLAWLRKQDTHFLAEKLQSPFREAYTQMVADVEQEEIQMVNEDDALTVEKLPEAVASVILHETAEQCQQFAASLVEAQQQLPPEAISLGLFFGCLAAALRGETPEVALLEVPFTEWWQEFQERLRVQPEESSQQEKGKHD
jgi:hypothetical protein